MSLIFLEAQASGQTATNTTLQDFLQLGQNSLKTTNWAQAKEAFQNAVALDSKNEEAQIGLARCFYHDKDYKQAIVSCKAAIALDATNSYPDRLLGLCYYKLGDLTNALGSFAKCLALAPGDLPARQYIGRSLAAAHRYDEAVIAYRAALKLKPDDFDTQYYLGLALFSGKRFQEASGAFQGAVFAKPDDYEGHYWLAYTRWRLDQDNDAISEFREAARIAPENFDPHFLQGLILIHLRQYPAAMPELEKAHQLKPDDRSAKLLLFCARLLTSQYRKAAGLYPIASVAAGIGLVISYLGGMSVLLWKSFKKGVATGPGFAFATAWILMFFEGQIAVTLLAGYFLPAYKMAVMLNAAIAGCAMPLIFAAAAGFPRQPWGEPFAKSRHFPSWKTIGFCVIAAVLVILLESALERAFRWVTGHSAPDQFIVGMLKEAFANAPWCTAVSVVILAPLSEEILFRGLLYGALVNRLTARWAIVISAAAFALVHLQTTYLLPLFIMGLLLGWMRHKTGALTASFLIHSLNNGAALVALKLLS